mgnify:FL=1
MQYFSKIAQGVFITISIVSAITVFLVPWYVQLPISILHLSTLIVSMYLIQNSNNARVVKIVACFIPNMIPVKLISYNGGFYYSMAKRKNSTQLNSTVYWFNYIGPLVLLHDGLVDDEASDASYIKFWIPLREQELVEHLLKYELPDFETILAIDDEHERTMTILGEFDRLKEQNNDAR